MSSRAGIVIHLLCGVFTLSCILGWSCVAAAQTSSSTNFYFVQLCDPQLGMTEYKEDICSLEQAVKQINALAPDFLLMCGDLVHKPNEKSYKDFRKIMESVTVPFHCLPGNHDMTLVKSGDTLQKYRELFGQDHEAFSWKGFRFILFNTQLMKIPMSGESEAQMSWLTDELKGTKKAGTVPVLVGHHPPFYNQPEEPESYESLPVDQRQALLALCTQYGVRNYLSGHTHHYVGHHYAAMDIVSGEASSMNTDGHPLGFRLWRVQGDQPWQSTFIPLYKRTQIKPKPTFDPSMESGTTAICMANLRQIDAAKEALGMQRHLPNGTVISSKDLSAFFKGGIQSLVCPDHGQYQINALGCDPQCTHPGHQLPYFYQFEEFQKRSEMQRQLKENRPVSE